MSFKGCLDIFMKSQKVSGINYYPKVVNPYNRKKRAQEKTNASNELQFLMHKNRVNAKYCWEILRIQVLTRKINWLPQFFYVFKVANFLVLEHSTYRKYNLLFFKTKCGVPPEQKILFQGKTAKFNSNVVKLSTTPQNVGTRNHILYSKV